ncbi:MAG: hypothetical protein NWQ46_03895 [Spirosomaceae bacterium]|nr:hypothetical protein [Spirosomataceae bacterium]
MKTDEGMKISRKYLSTVTAISLETAIRTRSDFKEEGLVEISSGTKKMRI